MAPLHPTFKAIMKDQQTLDKSGNGWRLSKKGFTGYEQRHYLRNAGSVRGEGPKHHGNGGLCASGFERDPVDLAVCSTTRAHTGDADDAGVRNLGYLTAELSSARFEQWVFSRRAAQVWDAREIFLSMPGTSRGRNPALEPGFVKLFDNE